MSQSYRIFLADTVYKRTTGLLFRPKLIAHEGLLIPRCKAVHTFGMRYAIAVFFFNADLRVNKYVLSLNPNRIAWDYRAKFVIELLALPQASARLSVCKLEAWIREHYSVDSFDSNTET